MPITNVSTYGSLQTLLQNMAQSQNNLNTDEIEISSDKKSQTFDGLGGQVEQLVSFNATVGQLTDYQQNNSVVSSQLQTTSTSLNQIEQVATSIKGLIASQLSGTTSAASFQQQLKADLGTLTAQLNTQYQGSYLFSGTATATAPVKSPLPDPITIGQLDTTYYQGSAQDSTLQITSSQSITNSIRADNPAFQNLFAGIQQALQSDAGTPDLENAENLITTGITGVIGLQATVNANIVNVQQADTQSQTLQTYYTGLSQNITNADTVSLSTQVAQDQTVLEASFETFSRISSLSLANYLK